MGIVDVVPAPDPPTQRQFSLTTEIDAASAQAHLTAAPISLRGLDNVVDVFDRRHLPPSMSATCKACLRGSSSR